MKIVKHFIALGLGLLSVLYLLNMGAGIFELFPDNIPILGNLDEAAATFCSLTASRILVSICAIYSIPTPERRVQGTFSIADTATGPLA